MTHELDAGAGELFEPVPLGSVADDEEPAAGDRPHPLPQAQQQIDPLVLDEPAHREEERLTGAVRARARLLDAVVDDADAFAFDAECPQRGGRRRRDGHQQTAALGAGQRPVLQSSPEPRGRASGPPKRMRHRSVWTWLTRRSVGPRCHSGARYGMPLHTSTSRSQSPTWRANAERARR